MSLRLFTLVMFICPVVAFAETVTVTTQQNRLLPGANNQGWWSESGEHEIGLDNYFTGHTIGFPRNQDYRGFLSFDLSSASGTVIEAHLEVRLIESGSPDPTETLGIFDISTSVTDLITTAGPSLSIFHDLGTGSLFGSYEVLIGAPISTVLTIPLNANGLAELNSKVGDWFSVGMAIQSLTNPRPMAIEGVFGAGAGFSNALIMTIVPEPTSFVLCVIAACPLWCHVVCSKSQRKRRL